MRIKLLNAIYISAVILLASCGKANNYSNGSSEVIKEWWLPVFSANENHLNTSIADTAMFHMQIFDDNSIRYEITVDSLKQSGDRVQNVEVHLGDPVTDGPVLIDLSARTLDNYGTGILSNIRQSLIDSLLDDNIDKYVSLKTAKVPAGLVRGQLNSKILLSKIVSLTGNNVVPPVTTTSTATAFIRITANGALYSKVVLNSQEANDPASGATLNEGAGNTNGPVAFTLVSSPADFNTAKKIILTDSELTTLLTSNYYVNVVSTLHPSGKLRGQIK